ncbi:MAG: hypothetical protein U5K51_06435 [Flavobacteriaceae bacterium]|nr:hypothetical protein [Flavobacteriaceae bacterium]
MELKNLLYIVLFSLAVASCKNSKENDTLSADAIYFGGDIITMEGDSAGYADAVAVKDGKIVFVGSKKDADKMQGDSTAMNDLQGKTIHAWFY